MRLCRTNTASLSISQPKTAASSAAVLLIHIQLYGDLSGDNGKQHYFHRPVETLFCFCEFSFFHSFLLLSRNGIFVVTAIIRTVIIGACHEAAHLILIKIDKAYPAVALLVVYIIYTIITICHFPIFSLNK